MSELTSVKRKWRPRLSLIIIAVCAALVTLPLLAMAAVRLTSNQFVRETERALLTQAAVLAEVYAQDYARLMPSAARGKALSKEVRARRGDRYHPVEPTLRTRAATILGPRPDGQPDPRPITKPYDVLGPELTVLAQRSQKSTLAGYLFLDDFGRAVASSATPGYNYAHIDEVAQALDGKVTSVLRYRRDSEDRHVLASISRDTAYRVYVAHPVFVSDKVVGVVYLSRTPLDLRKFLYQERNTLFRLLAWLVIGASIVGFFLWRLISGPIGKLRLQSQEVAAGRLDAPVPLARYGLQDLAELGRSIIQMGRAMKDRSDALETFTAHVTHELKSPVTSIVGAAELLKDAGDKPERAAKLAENIHAEGLRMNALLGRLRELARARLQEPAPPATLESIARTVEAQVEGLAVEILPGAGGVVPLSLDQGQIVLGHMAKNALEHGAKVLSLSWHPVAQRLKVTDDGRGISDGNIDRVTDPFFTTRRDRGGTGMGLAIVSAILEQADGRLRPLPSDQGAAFEISFAVPER